MLLAITSPSGNKSALPSVTRSLPQAEMIHKAVICRAANGTKIRCPELTGKDEHDRPLRDGHGHAHTIPADLDDDGRLDHILIYARMGLRDAAQRAIRSLKRTWTKGGAGDLQVAVVGTGDLDMLRRLQHPSDRRIHEILGPPEGSRVWESATPFVLPKTIDRRSKRRIPGQINAELASRQLPVAESVEIDPDLTRKLRHYVRRRTRGSVPPRMDAGYGLRLTFAEPVSGPLLLGYASHFGLGLFAACEK